jgi:hypothetical protein
MVLSTKSNGAQMPKFIVERTDDNKFRLMIPLSDAVGGDYLYVIHGLDPDGPPAEFDTFDEAVLHLKHWITFDDEDNPEELDV